MTFAIATIVAMLVLISVPAMFPRWFNPPTVASLQIDMAERYEELALGLGLQLVPAIGAAIHEIQEFADRCAELADAFKEEH